MKQLVVPSVFTAVDKFSGPVNKMAKKSNASLSRMERKMRNISSTAFSVSKKAAVFGAAIITPMGIFANEAIGFEEKMSNVSTLIDTSTESIDSMGDKVLEMSKKLPVPIDELTSSLYDIRSAGISAEKQFEVLESASKLSAAGLATVSEATNLSTSALNAFSSEGLSANDVNNMLFKTVKFGKTTVSELSQAFGATAPVIQSAGVKLADFSAATAALTTLGTPAAQAQNQIRASIVSLQKPSTEMQKVFNKLGVTSDKELIQKFGGLVGGFEAVNGAISELGLNTAKTWRSTEALGAVTSLTGATNEAYLKTLESMTNGVDDLSIAYDKQSKTGKAQMQMAKNTLKSLSITLGKAVLPLIIELVKTITPLIEKFAKWAKNNKKTFATIVKVIAVVGGLSIALSAVSGIIGAVTSAMGFFGAASMAALGPIGLIIGAAAALGAGIYAVTKAFNKQSRAQKLYNEVNKKALDATIDQRVEITMLFKALRKAEEGSEAYNATLQKLEAIQPGIIDKYNLQTKAIQNINAAEKDLINTIMERARVQAAEEMIVQKTKQIIQLEDEMKNMKGGTGPLGLGIDMKAIMQEEVAGLNQDINMLANQVADYKSVNPKKEQQNIDKQISETTKQEQIRVIFDNLPPGTKIEGGGFDNMMPQLGTTK